MSEQTEDNDQSKQEQTPEQKQEILGLLHKDRRNSRKQFNIIGWSAILLSIIAIVLVSIAWEQAAQAKVATTKIQQDNANLSAKIATVSSDTPKKSDIAAMQQQINTMSKKLANPPAPQTTSGVTQTADTSALQQQINSITKQLTDLSKPQSGSGAMSTQDLNAINSKLVGLQQNQTALQKDVSNLQGLMNKYNKQNATATPDLKAALLQVLIWVQNAEVSLQLNREPRQAVLYLQSSLQLLSAQKSTIRCSNQQCHSS